MISRYLKKKKLQKAWDILAFHRFSSSRLFKFQKFSKAAKQLNEKQIKEAHEVLAPGNFLEFLG